MIEDFSVIKYIGELISHRENWQIVASFANAIAILIAAWIARNSFNSWRDQRLQERKIDLADKCLASVYHCELAFDEMRSRSISFPKEYDEIYGAKASSQAYLDRMSRYNDAFDNIYSLLGPAKAVFGTDAHTAIKSFLFLRNELRTGIDAHVDIQGDDYGYPQSTKDFAIENRKLLFKSLGEDKFGATISQSVSQAKRIFEPFLK